jgi:hypothetical protein
LCIEGPGQEILPLLQRLSFTRTQFSRYSDLAESWTFRRWNPNRSKYFPLSHIQTSYGAHTDLLLFNVYRVSSLELKRPELDTDQFAQPSAQFKLVDLHLYSQYTSLFLGQMQLYVFTLPVASTFTFDRRTWSGLVWSDRNCWLLEQAANCLAS